MLCLKNVSVKNRLYELNCQFSAGQCVHILGNNGAGKSSFLSTVSKLLAYETGQIFLHNRLLTDFELAQLATFRCFQEQQQDSQFPITVRESLSFFSSQLPMPIELQEALEIVSFMDRRLDTLSGGERRRAHIARVLLQIWPAIQKGEGLILLDEPIQGLDYRHQHLLFTLLQDIALLGNLILVCHHDLNLCHRYANKVMLLEKGSILALGELESVMTVNNLERTFDCKIDCVIDQSGNRLFRTYLD